MYIYTCVIYYTYIYVYLSLSIYIYIYIYTHISAYVLPVGPGARV